MSGGVTEPEVLVDEWQIVATGGLGHVALILLAAAVVAGLIWTWRSLDPGQSARVRAAIMLLRAGALTMAVGLVLQPTLRIRRMKPLPSLLAILVDVSDSMTRNGDASRLAEVKRLLKTASRDIEKLERDHRVSWFVFDDHIREVHNHLEITTSDHPAHGTDIHGALTALAEMFPDDRLSSVVLISDGADTALTPVPKSGSDMEWVSALSTPINTASITRAGRQHDLSITLATADPFAFSRSDTPIDVKVRNIGFKQDQVEVTLWQEGAVMQRKTVSLIGGEGSTTFTILPSRLGRQVLTVSTEVPQGDEIPDNNTAHLAFEVLRDKFRILHLAGRPSWDQRFLRDTLRAWPQIDLVSFYILRTPYQSSTLGSAGLALIPFPTTNLFENHLNEFDVVIFQDFDPAGVGVDRYLPDIASFVERGGAFVLLGGTDGFGSGLLSREPISDVLPLKLLPANTPSSRMVDSGSFLPKITEAGERHPLMQLTKDPSANLNLWKSVAHLDGIVRVAGAVNEAVVLAQHPHLRADNGPAPLLAVRDVGKGRTLTITTDSTWRWRFTGPMGGGSAEVYPNLWRRIIAWLTHDPELDRLRVNVSPATVDPGDFADIEIELLDVTYRPMSGAKLEMAISWFDDSGVEQQDVIPVRLDEEGRFRREWEPRLEGPHKVRVTAPNDLRANDRFLVKPARIELQHLDPDISFMEAIATSSGGLHTVDTLDLPGIGMKDTIEQEVLSREDFPIWDHPIPLVLLLSMLFGEWLLRRRMGLR